MNLQALRPQLPIGLAAVLPAVASQPLALTLERLLLRRPAELNEPPERWLEAVLAAYTAVAVLAAAPEQQAEAEHQLLATLGDLQQAAALRSISHSAARQAVASATAQLGCGEGTSSLQPAPEQQKKLRKEGLQHLTSPACLEAAAVGQLLANRLHQQMALVAAAALPSAGAQQQPEAQHPPEAQQTAAQALSSLLHSPLTQLELELLCLVALLPCWEGMLQRLAGLDTTAERPSSSTHQRETPTRTAGQQAAGAAVQLLCAACSSQPQHVMRQHPALLAEVCRQSFRFTCAYARLLASQQRAAAEDTLAAAQAARWRLAHATKHRDHVSDYLLAKCSSSTGPNGSL